MSINPLLRAYAKVMAENERHLRLEGQRHSKEKSDLRHSLAQKENKRVGFRTEVGPVSVQQCRPATRSFGGGH